MKITRNTVCENAYHNECILITAEIPGIALTYLPLCVPLWAPVLPHSPSHPRPSLHFHPLFNFLSSNLPALRQIYFKLTLHEYSFTEATQKEMSCHQQGISLQNTYCFFTSMWEICQMEMKCPFGY